MRNFQGQMCWWRFAGSAAIAASGAIALPAQAELSAEELAKLAQNPVGNLVSVPFQNNTNLNYGPENKTQNILNIQPVIPVSVNEEWNIITRTILPVVSQPALYPGDDRTNGLGDTVFTAFLSPAPRCRWRLVLRCGKAYEAVRHWSQLKWHWPPKSQPT